MELIVLNEIEYSRIFNKNSNVFCSTEFTHLNSHFFEEIRYLAFVENNKYKAGIIFGKNKETLYAPPKAPFSGLNKLKDISLESVDKIVSLLENYSNYEKLNIEITFPPLIYDTNFYSNCINSFFRSKFITSAIDLSFYLNVNKLMLNYINLLPRSGKKNLSNGLKAESIELLKSDNKEFIDRAYKIIKANRESKRYPLRMTFDQVMKTVEIIKSDFFILKINRIEIASAQIFYVKEDVVQVIYWGDISGYEHLRPMNVLAFKILEFYKNTDVKIIDIGPSTENSIPNYGLCNFKNSIGCDISLKYKFSHNIKCDD